MKIRLAVVFVLAVLMPVSAFAGDVGVIINEVSVNYNHEYGVPFVDSAYRTQVPLRATMEALGCDIYWDDINFSARVIKGNTILDIPAGKNYILKNGKTIQNDTESMIIDGRIYLPIRIVLESLGYFVGWDSGKNCVTVDTSSQLMQVHFIDVGQGDSILIDFDNYEILIDGGDNNKGDVVSKYLYPYVDGNLELIIATHPDADHIGGLDIVLRDYVVERVIDSGKEHNTKTYNDYINAVKKEKCIFEYDDNISIELGNNAVFSVFETGDERENNNDMSVVCALNYGDTNVLFTGDISQKVERDLINNIFDVDVLKIAHHGSKTSTSQEFLDKVKPEYSVISAGVNNKYGHPAPEIIKRLNLSGVKVLGTFAAGNIVLSINENGYGFNKGDYI